MKNNSVKNKLFLSIVFFLLTSTVFVFLYTKTMSNHKISEDNLLKWEKEYLKQDEINTLNRSIASVEEKKNLLETHFAKSSDVVPFLDFLENLAKNAGLQAGVSLVDLPEKEDGLIIEMKTTGDFKTTYKFLKLLENSPYQLELISVDLQNGAKKEEVSPNSTTQTAQKTEWEALLRIKLLSFIK
jgi:hypothetical protein